MGRRYTQVIPQAFETTCISRAKEAFAAAIQVSDHELMRMVVDENSFETLVIDRLVEHSVYEVSVRLSWYPIRTITQERTVSWPDGWWQALRERVLPRKWLNKHPVLRRYAKLMCCLDLSSIYRQVAKAPKDTRPVVLCDTEFVCQSIRDR